MEEKMVSVANGRFEVQTLEAGTGDDVVFLHGAGGLTWDPFLEALSQKYHVIAPHLPGTGESTGGEHVFDHHDGFYFYLDFMDAMGLDQVHLIGHSMGGWMAAEVAAMQPRRFESVTLLSPIGLWSDDYPVLDIWAMLPNEIAEAVFHDVNHPAAQMMLAVPSDPAELGQLQIQQTKTGSMAAKFMWPIPDKGLKNRIHRITSPTLVLWGASDKLAPVQYADDFGRLIESSTVEIIKEAGHLPQLEQTEATLEKVLAHLG
jgi:pimeloyl-ACP methyl ester carboxylesterase